MKTGLDLALVLVGLAGLVCGIALACFSWWLGGRSGEMAWPFQLGILAFALLFGLGGAAAIRIGLKSS
jgi:hypothetical protein